MIRRGQTLVATLIVILIIGILAVVLLQGTQGGVSSRADGKGTTVVGAVKAEAQDEVCKSNLGQVRTAITIARTNGDDQPPATLDENGLSAEYRKCPMGGEPYQYDPTNGEVHCTHPGHEKY